MTKNYNYCIEDCNSKFYYLNFNGVDVYHRLDGPAIEWHDGNKFWWFEGKYITNKSQEEFERIIRLKLFW